MLTIIKKHVWNIKCKYHYHMAMYCFKKYDEYGPEHNEYWGEKLRRHVHKESELVKKIFAC